MSFTENGLKSLFYYKGKSGFCQLTNSMINYIVTT